MSKWKPTVAIDFDGTLCDHEYPAIGKIKPGAREALEAIRKSGYRIIIWSCRTCNWATDVFGVDENSSTLERKHVQAMIAWLKDNQIPYDEIDDGTKGKPMADIYIDDKAIRFRDNWDEIKSAFEHNVVDNVNVL